MIFSTGQPDETLHLSSQAAAGVQEADETEGPAGKQCIFAVVLLGTWLTYSVVCSNPQNFLTIFLSTCVGIDDDNGILPTGQTNARVDTNAAEVHEENPTVGGKYKQAEHHDLYHTLFVAN